MNTAANLSYAVNYPSHRNLPESENIVYFEKDDTTDFINSILNSTKKVHIHKDLNEFTLDNRIKKLLVCSTPGGFEPQPSDPSQMLYPVTTTQK